MTDPSLLAVSIPDFMPHKEAVSFLLRRLDCRCTSLNSAEKGRFQQDSSGGTGSMHFGGLLLQISSMKETIKLFACGPNTSLLLRVISMHLVSDEFPLLIVLEI